MTLAIIFRLHITLLLIDFKYFISWILILHKCKRHHSIAFERETTLNVSTEYKKGSNFRNINIDKKMGHRIESVISLMRCLFSRVCSNIKSKFAEGTLDTYVRHLDCGFDCGWLWRKGMKGFCSLVERGDSI